MAITDKEQGVWDLDQVYNKINQGGIWSYDGITKFMSVGVNGQGQLGLNNTTTKSSPTQVPGTDWDLSFTGASDSFVLNKTDGTLWTVGNNEYGGAAQNNATPGYSSPVQIPGTTWDFVWNNNGQAIKGTKTDGTMWVWGSAHWGVTGLNVSHPGKIGYSSPVQLPGSWATGVNKHSGASSVAHGIKADGTLWIWGYGGDGQLAQGNNTPKSSPVQIGSGTDWSTVVLGNDASHGAIKTDGTLWVWGNNQFGQLGQNSATGSGVNSPVQIPGTTWDRAAFSSYSLYAFKTDGTLWAGGYNSYGQLGQNNTTQRSSPVQITGTTWSKVAPFSASMVALKSDNTLWSWGLNQYGYLGHNNISPADYSSPTQIPGTWTQVAPTSNGFWAKFAA